MQQKIMIRLTSQRLLSKTCRGLIFRLTSRASRMWKA